MVLGLSNACLQTSERFYLASMVDDPSGSYYRGHAHRGMRRAVGYKCNTRAPGDRRDSRYLPGRNFPPVASRSRWQ
jgi:hypothetical protein